MENAKVQKFKCDILSEFQTLWSFGKMKLDEMSFVILKLGDMSFGKLRLSILSTFTNGKVVS